MKNVIEKAYKALSRRCENVVKKRKLSVIGFRIIREKLVLECKTHESNDIEVVYVLYKRKHNGYYKFMNFPRHASRALSCRETVLMNALSRDDVAAVSLDLLGLDFLVPLDASWFMYKNDILKSLTIECDMPASEENGDNEA